MRKVVQLLIQVKHVRSILYTCVGIVGVALTTGLFFGWLEVSDNFHTVIDGELYRSAQLEPGEITEMAKNHGIKTIINLRGENEGSPWYDNELLEAKRNNINHLNFRMSSKRELTDDQKKRLTTLIAVAPKPVLIHCRGGSDRSGLAAALYLKSLKQPQAASSQLSLFYGHLPSFGTDKMCATLNTTEGVSLHDGL